MFSSSTTSCVGHKRQATVFQSSYTSLCYSDLINQDLNMAESLDPNCKQPSKTIHSVMEFDTELFQIHIRELFQEFPELSDDSTPVQDDIHNFLPEHITASHKTRDKSKRKAPKFTAANQRKPSQT
ncbi:unnamed protein product [Hymenolepis diminuta]|uniref:Uncharacterized protein n=1 Tax=Hymenolepis diminuta TaxID=6216 RepID=A0A564Z2P5_HYMDI|nr:unnamed protein product [Hymenolepis diminuta]